FYSHPLTSTLFPYPTLFRSHVGVGGVAPELPELIWRQHRAIQPGRAARRLAHLAPVRRGQQRRGQPPDFPVQHPPGQVDPVDDIDRKSTRLNSSHVKISYAV